MKKKKVRLQLIKSLIREHVVGCQEDLAKLLSDEGVHVTQATLSRDLKALRITKVANEQGAYMYVMADNYEPRMAPQIEGERTLGQSGMLSLDFSGNFAVIKTRNGYASGLAYDIEPRRNSGHHSRSKHSVCGAARGCHSPTSRACSVGNHP